MSREQELIAKRIAAWIRLGRLPIVLDGEERDALAAAVASRDWWPERGPLEGGGEG